MHGSGWKRDVSLVIGALRRHPSRRSDDGTPIGRRAEAARAASARAFTASGVSPSGSMRPVARRYAAGSPRGEGGPASPTTEPGP